MIGPIEGNLTLSVDVDKEMANRAKNHRRSRANVVQLGAPAVCTKVKESTELEIRSARNTRALEISK